MDVQYLLLTDNRHAKKCMHQVSKANTQQSPRKIIHIEQNFHTYLPTKQVPIPLKIISV
jgi:hypothetical protein